MDAIRETVAKLAWKFWPDGTLVAESQWWDLHSTGKHYELTEAHERDGGQWAATLDGQRLPCGSKTPNVKGVTIEEAIAACNECEAELAAGIRAKEKGAE